MDPLEDVVPLGDFFISRDYQTVRVNFPGTAIEQNIDCLTAAATDFDLTGQILWLVSRVMAHHFAATDGAGVRGKVVLEIGAGAGLVGLCCTQWARACVLSDYEDEVLTLLKRNQKHCYPSCRVIVAPLSWGEEESHVRALALADGLRAHDTLSNVMDEIPVGYSGFDTIVGADVVYWSQSVAPLMASAAALLSKPHGEMFIGYTARVSGMRQALLDAALAVGLQYEVIPWVFGATGVSVPPVPPYPAESLARMELFRFTWPRSR